MRSSMTSFISLQLPHSPATVLFVKSFFSLATLVLFVIVAASGRIELAEKPSRCRKILFLKIEIKISRKTRMRETSDSCKDFKLS